MVDNYAVSKTKLFSSYMALTTIIILMFFLGLSITGTVSTTASSIRALEVGQQQQQTLMSIGSNSSITGSNNTNISSGMIDATNNNNSTDNNNDPATLIYQNPKFGIQIRYPENWIYKDEENTVTGDFMTTFMSPEEALKSQRAGGMPPLVGVFTRLLPFANLDLHTFGELNIQGLTSSGNKIISNNYDAILSGMSAFEVIYVDLNGSKILQDWTFRGDRAYAVIYGSPESSFEQFLPIAQGMITSFKITNNTTTTAGTTGSQLSQSHQQPSIINPTTNGNQAMTLEVARQRYLQAWNQTEFYVPFSTYIEPGSATGYGVYKEHSSNIFGRGETIQLYLEPVAFGHQKIIDQDGTTLYLLNLTADVLISNRNGDEVAGIEAIPLGTMVSHRPNTELHATVTLTQETAFPAGDYIIAYIIHDQISGGSFQINKRITVADETLGIAPVREMQLPPQR